MTQKEILRLAMVGAAKEYKNRNESAERAYKKTGQESELLLRREEESLNKLVEIEKLYEEYEEDK